MTRETKVVRGWLAAVYFGVVLMTMVGGITRLTGSGLSIVEWKPVTGLLPPLGHDAWVRAFDAYRASPQGSSVNAWMKLEDFERIFAWEYVHRLLGRFEFLVAFVPWLYFNLRASYSENMRGLWPASIWVLVALQGTLGWFMVASGLWREPAVSHLRLAAHLGLAFFIGQWTLWNYLSLDASLPSLRGDSRRFRKWSAAFLALLCLQVVYGAFMSGRRAGHMFSTFPDMAGRYLPSSAFFTGNLAFDLVHSQAGIHYVHRTIAWFVLAVGFSLAVTLFRQAGGQLRRRAALLAAVLLLQVALGALTVVFAVPLGLAVGHQIVGMLLLSAAVALHHGLVRRDVGVAA